ncbi:hypothetical protein ACFQ9B_46235, partial [Streptomyces sp. NPDC056549]
MLARAHAHRRTVLSLLVTAQVAAFSLASRAAAAPTPPATPSPNPSDDRCALISGPSRHYCVDGPGGTGGGDKDPLTDPTASLDPLKSLARGFADAAISTIDYLSTAVKETADVDFTNMQFLGRYAIVFAAATFLTLLLWLLAVAKRAVRGVPLTTALSEAIGFLWLTVLASA